MRILHLIANLKKLIKFKHSLKIVLLFLFLVMVGGCASSLYMHDEDLELQLRASKSQYQKATSENEELWSTLHSNLDKVAELEIKALTNAGLIKRQTDLQNIKNHTWSGYFKEANDIVIKTNDEIQDLSKSIEDTGNMVNKLFDSISKIEESLTGVKIDRKGLNHFEAGTAKWDKVKDSSNELKKISEEIREIVANKIKDEVKDKIKGEIGDEIEKRLNEARQKFKENIKDYIGSTRKMISDDDKKIPDVLRKFTNDEGLNEVLALLRKSKNHELIGNRSGPFDLFKNRGGKIKSLRDAPGKMELSDKARKKLSKFLKLEHSIETAGELRKFLEKQDSSIEEIRLTIEKEHRRTIAVVQNAQFQKEKDRLELYNLQLEILGKYVDVAQMVKDGSEKYNQEGNNNVFKSLNESYLNYQKGIKPEEMRDGFYEKLETISGYVHLTGYLYILNEITKSKINILAHREAIANEQIATDSYTHLVNWGLDGLISFAEGGITDKDIANWFKAFESTLLGVISVKVDD